MKKIFTNSIVLTFILIFFFISITSFKVDFLKYRISNSGGLLHELQKRNGTTGYGVGHIKDIFEAWYKNDWYPIKNDVSKKLLLEKKTKISNIKNTDIIMRDGSTIFQGEFYRLHYAIPGYIINKKISPITTNIILALISLFLLTIVCIKENKIIFLIIFVLALISSDYYVYENFINENIFAVPISISIIFYSLFYIFNKSMSKYFYLYSFFFGVLISLFANVRTEFIFLIFTYLISIIIYYDKKKILLSSFILIIVFSISNNFLNDEFTKKINKTNLAIKEKNGVAYTGPIGSGHTFWHPFWMGFGDNIIGQKLGFQWGDIYAYNYVATVNSNLFKKNDIQGHRLNSSYDLYGIYKKKPELIPEYQLTLKHDLIDKFKVNKIEFFKIYLIKIKNCLILLQGIDYSFFGNIFLKKYFNGFYMLLISLFTISYFVITQKNKIKLNFYFKFIYISLPTGLSALIVSDMGATYVSYFHFILFGSIFQITYDLLKANLPLLPQQ